MAKKVTRYLFPKRSAVLRECAYSSGGKFFYDVVSDLLRNASSDRVISGEVIEMYLSAPSFLDNAFGAIVEILRCYGIKVD